MSPEQLLMIGDDIEADIGGAQAAGLRAALVKTGKFRATDLDTDVRPEILLNSVGDLPRWWTAGQSQVPDEPTSCIQNASRIGGILGRRPNEA
jgi:hypothetical protein